MHFLPYLLGLILCGQIMVNDRDVHYALLFPSKTTTNTYSVELVQDGVTNKATRALYKHEFDLSILRTNWLDANALSVVLRGPEDELIPVGLSVKRELRSYVYQTSQTNEVGILVWKRVGENPPVRLYGE